MPEIVIPPGYAHVDHSIQLTGYNRVAHVTYGVEIAGAPTPDILAGVLRAVWAVGPGSRMDGSTVNVLTQVTIGQDGEPLVGESVGTAPGGRTMDATAPALALRCRKRTMLGGRRNSGSFFLPWALGDNQVTEVGQVSTAEVTGWQTVLDAWLVDLTTESLIDGMVILHRTGGSAVPPPTPVTSLQVVPTISHQVRRQQRQL